jgi:hypothetical protein
MQGRFALYVVERTYIKKEEINQCLDDQDLGNKIPSCPV